MDGTHGKRKSVAAALVMFVFCPVNRYGDGFFWWQYLI